MLSTFPNFILFPLRNYIQRFMSSKFLSSIFFYFMATIFLCKVSVSCMQCPPSCKCQMFEVCRGVITFPTLVTQLRLLAGRKLQYEVKYAKPEIEHEFVTLVWYTREAPFGQATSLFNWKSGIIEVSATSKYCVSMSQFPRCGIHPSRTSFFLLSISGYVTNLIAQS